MPQKTVNISLGQDLWDSLSKLAHEQSILKGKRFPTIKTLRDAIRIFLRLKPKEINEVLKWNTRNIGWSTYDQDLKERP